MLLLGQSLEPSFNGPLGDGSMPPHCMGHFLLVHGDNAHAFYVTCAFSLDTTRHNKTLDEGGGVLSAVVCHTMVNPMTHLELELCPNTLHASSSQACEQ